MEIDILDAQTLQRLYLAHQAMTQAALMQVFAKTEQQAAQAVRDLWSQYEFAPERERHLLLHNDPVALACDLAGCEWSSVSKDLLEKFNAAREPTLKQSLGIL